MNPCMLAVCLQQNVPKILVGDQHQQIYSFRGAVNALDLVSSLSTEIISRALGLDQRLLANSCLMGSDGPDLVGSSKSDSVIDSLAKL